MQGDGAAADRGGARPSRRLPAPPCRRRSGAAGDRLTGFPCNAPLLAVSSSRQGGRDHATAVFHGSGGEPALSAGVGAVHQLPEISQGNIAMAQDRGAMAAPPQRRCSADDEVLRDPAHAIQLVGAPATKVCSEMNVGVCEWKFRMSRDGILNAGAMGTARSCSTAASSSMPTTRKRSAWCGPRDRPPCRQPRRQRRAQSDDRRLARRRGGGGRRRHCRQQSQRRRDPSAAQLGATIGGLSFSKEQEREADYMAALILYRAGVDLDKARGLLVTMAAGRAAWRPRSSTRTRPGPNGSPPGIARSRKSVRRTAAAAAGLD